MDWADLYTFHATSEYRRHPLLSSHKFCGSVVWKKLIEREASKKCLKDGEREKREGLSTRPEIILCNRFGDIFYCCS